MKKNIARICAMSFILMGLFTGLASADKVEKVLNDFESYTVGAAPGALAENETSNATMTIANRAGSKVLQLKSQGADNQIVRINKFGSADFSTADSFSFWVDASEFSSFTGTKVRVIDTQNGVWKSKESASFSYTFTPDGGTAITGSSDGGYILRNLGLAAANMVGTVSISFENFQFGWGYWPTPDPMPTAPLGIIAMGLEYNGLADLSVYVDNIKAMVDETAGPGPGPGPSTLPDDKKVVQDFSKYTAGAFPAADAHMYPDNSMNLSVVASGALKQLKAEILSSAADTWRDFGIKNIEGNWTGATYLFLSLDMNGNAGLGIQPVLVDAGDRRFDFTGSKYYLIGDDEVVHEIDATGAGGQCRWDAGEYGSKVTLVVSLSDFTFSQWGDNKTEGAMDLSGVKIVRLGFPVSTDGTSYIGKSIYIQSVGVYGVNLVAGTIPGPVTSPGTNSSTSPGTSSGTSSSAESSTDSGAGPKTGDNAWLPIGFFALALSGALAISIKKRRA